MNSLELLRDRLDRSLKWSSAGTVMVVWGQPQLMTKALSDVRKAFDAPVTNIPDRSITKVLLAYRCSGLLQSFLDLKYACFGIGHDCTDGWRLLNDAILFPKLLDKVDDLRGEPRRFRKCYQGLLSGYFGYPLFDSEMPSNWNRLCAYLDDRLAVAEQATQQPSWLAQLAQHRNLLGPKPCDRYFNGQDLAPSDLRHTLHVLGVPRESWLWQELIISQVEETCRKEDNSFKKDLDHLIKNVLNTDILSEILLVRCTAILVSRYVQCSSKPEHPALRDAAVSYIGNPWLKKTAWDAHVKTKDGQPHEAARQMVNGWIKRRLIKDFFELLSDDGSADQRRLNYWLRFEPVVEDMWFAVGPHASKHPSPDFKEFRNRARGRLLILEKPGTPLNNAFIMCLGPVTVVEFWSEGNATYMYQSENLPFDLGKSFISGDSSELKNQQVGQRFIHKGVWEERLDAILCPLIGFRPTQKLVTRLRAEESPTKPAQKLQPPPMPPPIINPSVQENEFVLYIKNILHLPVEDRRPIGGALWVRMDNNTSDICPLLMTVGFKYKPGVGWWKE